MTEIECILNKKSQSIQCAILYLGSRYQDWRLKELIDHTNLDTLIVTGCITSKQASAMIENLKLRALCGNLRVPESFYFCPLSKIKSPKKEFALLCEALDSGTEILPLAELQPSYLYGQIPGEGVSSFIIWETFRKSCKQIQLITVYQERERKVLDWEKDPENNIELSVIFPMYNVGKYLDQCIQSVTAWKADYVEFLFVNDGSHDNSREVVLRYAVQDSRVKLLDKPNGGCASARQWGLDRAKGKYIGFIDPDDFIDESMFRKLLRAAMVGSYDISYCGYNEYYESTGISAPVEDLLGEPYCYGVTDVRKIQELIAWRRVAIWRGIYKMDMIRKNHIHFYTEIRRFDDLPFFIETTATARSIVSVNEHLYYYRLNRPGQDISADDQRLYVHFPIFAHLNNSIASKKDAKLTDMLQLSKVGTHRYAMEKLRPEFIKEYSEQAREDFKTTGTFWRSYFLIRKMSGRDNAKFYWAIMTNNYKWLGQLCKKKKLAERLSE